MKNVFILCISFLLMLTTSAQIFPGLAPMGLGDEFLIGVRYRNLTLSTPLAGNEKYVGVPDLNLASQRVETNLAYAATQQMSFTYDDVANNITAVTTIAGTPTTLTMSNISTEVATAGKLRTLNQMNVLQIRIRNRTPSSTTTVSGITLNSIPIPGVFSVSGNNNTQYWFAFFSGYGTTFNLTASIQLSGSYTGSGDDNVVEFLWGSSLAVLPITIQNTSVSTSNGFHFINYELGNYANNSVVKSVLENSHDGLQFTAIDSTTSINRFNYFKSPQFSNINFYRIKLVLQNGDIKYSVILNAHSNTLRKPYKVHYMGNAVLLISTSGQFKRITIYSIRGKQIKSIDVNDTDVLIHLDDLPKGTYILHFQIGSVKYVERFVY